MKVFDRLWLAMYAKRPPSRWSGYISIFTYGAVTLVIFLVSLAFLTSTRPWVGWCSLAVGVGYAVCVFVTDSKDGYVDVIHKRQLERWGEKKKRLETK